MARNAILIGCDQFREPEIFAPLRFPAQDVERLAALLQDPRYGRFDSVHRLLNPAADEARRMLERVFSRSRPDDLTLFYYSGHGKLRRDGCLALIMADTDSEVLASTALGSDELKSRINESPAGQKLVILDCCYSGAFGPEGLRGGSADAPLSDLPVLATGSHVLTASTRFQVARELETLGGGILTDAIIRGVETGEAAPANRSTITLADLVQYVQSALAADGGQAPQYWASESSGPVVIANKTRAFDAEWVASARRAMSIHESNDSIDQETADQARDCLRTAADPARRPDLELIDDLVAGRISPGQFVRTWVSRRLAHEAGASTPPKPRRSRAAAAKPAVQKPAKAVETPQEAPAPAPAPIATVSEASPRPSAASAPGWLLSAAGAAVALAIAIATTLLAPGRPQQPAPAASAPHTTARYLPFKLKAPAAETPTPTLTGQPVEPFPLQPAQLIGGSTILAEWTKAENRSECAPVGFRSDGGKGGHPRRANYSGGWSVAFDLPRVRSAYGVAGAGVDGSADEASKGWPYVKRYPAGSSLPQGSVAGYGLAGGEPYPANNPGGVGVSSLAYLYVGGQKCLYNVWSELGKAHLELLLSEMHVMDTAGPP